MDRTALAAEAALTETGDAFEALSHFVHTSADERISALCPMIQSTFDKHHPDLEAARERLEEQVEGIMKRARDAGQLRSDVGVGDLMIAVSQLSRPRPSPSARAPTVSSTATCNCSWTACVPRPSPNCPVPPSPWRTYGGPARPDPPELAHPTWPHRPDQTSTRSGPNLT